MSDMLIKNAVVFDPINSVAGETMDLCIRDGKIVSDVKSPEVIDAEKRLVMPGGVELHTHVAGGKVNAGRIMRPEDSRINTRPRTKITRVCTGRSVPNTFSIGYIYAKMGYTTIFEAAMPPLMARHTHEELEDIPIVDKGAFTLLNDSWLVMEYIKQDDMDKLTAFVAWMIKQTRGMVVKIVNPGGVEAWSWGKNVHSIHDQVPNFDVTPVEIIRSLAIVNERLGMPHSVHVHCNNLGHPGNYETTLETFDAVKDITPGKNRQTFHATHTQFHSYAGSNWGDMGSAADKIAEYVNKYDHVTIDLGQVMFGDTTTMTADGPMEFNLHKLSRRKWSNHDVELETGSGIIPVYFSPKVSVNALQWAIGLELALLINDPWKVVLTTDHPNGCPFTCYPDIISLLMSKAKRDEMIANVHEAVQSRANLPAVDRELDWIELAIMTRAGPARMLSLVEHGKGHLGIGADADVSIFDVKPDEFDPSRKEADVARVFANTKYTIKGGQTVVRDGEIVATPDGRTIWVNPQVSADLEEAISPDIDEKFLKYYSVGRANYGVQDAYLPHPYEIKAGEGM